ncbi:MAG: hypothetical protein ACYDHW_10095 [Syntrophorhabdaceae bacterium]
MASLVDNVISLEKEADVIVEQARANSKSISKESENEIARYRDEQAVQLEIRLNQFRTDVERRYEDSLAKIVQEKTEKLSALKKLPDDYILLQANKIIDRFNNW